MIDISAEKELLSAAIFKDTAVYKIMECDEKIFYSHENKIIFQAMSQLYHADEKVDLSSLRLVLGDRIKPEYLADIMQCQYVANIDYIIRELKQKAYKRELMTLAKDLYVSVKSGKVEFQDFVNRIIEINDELNSPEESLFTTMAEMSDLNLDDIFQSDNYVKTGIPALDEHILGMFKGQLIVFAAPPGMGKTTLAWQIACNVPDSIFISLEMKRQELYAKLLSRYTDISTLRIEGKQCTDDEVLKLLKAKEKIKKEIRLTLFDSDLGYFKMINTVKKLAKQKNVSMVAIDYLQLIEGAPGENHENRISTVTRTCKKLAFNLNIPVVLLSQLTKDVLKEGREPTLGDLRGSGAIGQDADSVVFLYEKDADHYLTIGKLRKGRIGRVANLKFNKASSRFDSIDLIHAVNPEYFQD
jgi:replicative DNA helicase